jgi:hypothetical protein
MGEGPQERSSNARVLAKARHAVSAEFAEKAVPLNGGDRQRVGRNRTDRSSIVDRSGERCPQGTRTAPQNEFGLSKHQLRKRLQRA